MKILSLLAEKETFELEYSEKADFLIHTLTVICVIHNTSVPESADHSGSLRKGYYLHNFYVQKEFLL